MNSAITPCETDCRNSPAAAIKSKPDSQSSSGHSIKTELIDSMAVDKLQAANQFAIVLGIKVEPVDDSVTSDTFQPTSQPAIVPDIKAEPADSYSSPQYPWSIVKSEDSEQAFSSRSDVVESQETKANGWKTDSSLKVKFDWRTGLSGENMITSNSSSNIKTNNSELMTADVRNDDSENEAVATCIREAISKDEEKNRPEGVKQNEGSFFRTSPQPSATERTLQPSANTSGSLLPLSTSHVCQHCSAAFVLLSSWKQHMASVHGDSLAAFPGSSTPEGSDVGQCGSMDSEKRGGILDDRKSEEKKNDRTGDNQTGRTCKEKGRPHVCDVCNKAFKRVGHLKSHKLIHTGLKQFVCDMCSKAFTEAGHLKKHKFRHIGLKQYVCDVCSKAFTEAGDLKRHKLIHTGHKQFVCDVCSKAFMNAGNLKQHKLIHTGQKQFVCDVCSKAFTHACNLKQHKLIHSDLRQLVCGVCSKACTEAGNLMQDKLIHTGLKHFVCDGCSKAFTEAFKMKQHMLSHTGLTQYVCDVCFKTFTEAGNLKQHKLIHTGLKQFVCDVCSKAFTQAGNLKRHKLLHTGLKQFVCDVCSKAFAEAGNLKQHKLIHTSHKQFV